MAAGWSVTLSWQDILNIVLGAVTIFQFLRNRKTKQVCREAIQGQTIQTAAHGFAEMATLASELETWVGKNEWERSLELAKRLMVSLAEASGSWRSILETTDIDNFDAARSEIRSVESAVSQAGQNAPTDEKREEMRQQCMNAAIYVTTIAGRLKSPSELREANVSLYQRILGLFSLTAPQVAPASLSKEELNDIKEAVKDAKKVL